MTIEEIERLTEYLIAKVRPWAGGVSPEDLDTIIRTTVADVWLVLEGTLTVDDFKP